MESLGAFPDGEWDSISRLLFAEDSFQNNDNGGLNSEVNPLSFWFSEEADKSKMEIDESLLFSSDNPNSNLGNFCQESSACGYSSSIFLPTQSQDNYYLSDYNHIPYINNSSGTFDLSMLAQKNICSDLSVCPDVLTRDVKLDGCHSEAGIVPETESHLKRKSDILEHEARPDNKSNESPKKRSRVSRERVNKNAHSKKSQKLTPILDDEEEDNAGQNGQTTSCDSSDDDSNASLELSGGPNSDSKVAETVNLKAKKTKASKVSATDSQSIYARKRREKINERLKILQNLVPNGTKVDISTMLEEAVHYVKFLQVQIKLLSSDDHWMYAPLAYNGMDIGFLRTISPTL